MVGEEVRSQVCVYVRSRLRFVYLLDCVIASLGRLASLRVWFDLAVACLVELQPAWQAWQSHNPGDGEFEVHENLLVPAVAAPHAVTTCTAIRKPNCRPRRVMLTLGMMRARAEGG